jgi:hypothetical protein
MSRRLVLPIMQSNAAKLRLQGRGRFLAGRAREERQGWRAARARPRRSSKRFEV